MANILAVASTEATSTDVTLADGAGANLVMISGADGAIGFVRADTSASVDTEIGQLTKQKDSVSVRGPGTFRVHRPGGKSFGVDSL